MKLAVLVISIVALLSAVADWTLSSTSYSSVLLVAVPLALTASGLGAVAAARRQHDGLSALLFGLTLVGALAIFSGVTLATSRFSRQPALPSPEKVAQIRLWILTPLFVLPLAALGSLMMASPKLPASVDR